MTIFFVFAHSELDFFTPDNHFHDSHDFCDIIEKAKVEDTFTSIDKTLHLEFYTLNTCSYYSGINFHFLLNTRNKQRDRKNIPAYLVNNILLI